MQKLIYQFLLNADGSNWTIFTLSSMTFWYIHVKISQTKLTLNVQKNDCYFEAVSTNGRILLTLEILDENFCEHLSTSLLLSVDIYIKQKWTFSNNDKLWLPVFNLVYHGYIRVNIKNKYFFDNSCLLLQWITHSENESYTS